MMVGPPEALARGPALPLPVPGHGNVDRACFVFEPAITVSRKKQPLTAKFKHSPQDKEYRMPKDYWIRKCRRS